MATKNKVLNDELDLVESQNDRLRRSVLILLDMVHLPWEEAVQAIPAKVDELYGEA